MRIYHYRWMSEKVMTVIKFGIVFSPLNTVDSSSLSFQDLQVMVEEIFELRTVYSEKQLKCIYSSI